MKDKIKNATIIGTILASLGGTFYAGQEVGKPECDYVIVYEMEEICITEEIKQAIESGLKANAGFGGVRF
ncbi:hypothetical protein LCGC14_2048780, partial [marine sediment metagenome]